MYLASISKEGAEAPTPILWGVGWGRFGHRPLLGREREEQPLTCHLRCATAHLPRKQKCTPRRGSSGGQCMAHPPPRSRWG